MNKLSKPTLYIMCGVSFSGKTTLARVIVSRLGMKYVGIDDILLRTEEGDDKSGTVSDERWEKVFRQAYTKVTQELMHGHDVIFDSSNQTRKDRDLLRQVAEKAKGKSVVIYVMVEKEIAINRKNENYHSKERSQLSEEHFMHILNTLEEPSEEENVMIYSTKENTEQWINKNLILNQ